MAPSTNVLTFLFFIFSTMSLAAPLIGIINGTLPTLSTAVKLFVNASAAAYNGTLTDSQGQVFWLTIRANNAKYNGHNIQLMPGSPASFAVVDLASPVLLLTLRNGALATVGTNDFNQPFLLGQVGGLRDVTGNSTMAAQSFIFRNQTSTAASVFNQTSHQWYLLGGGHTAAYGLYQQVPAGWVNGFIICSMDDGEYYQLFYYEYMGLIPNFGSECEFVALETTVAPYV